MNNSFLFNPFPGSINYQEILNSYEKLQNKVERLEKNVRILENRLNIIEKKEPNIITNDEPRDMYMI